MNFDLRIRPISESKHRFRVVLLPYGADRSTPWAKWNKDVAVEPKPIEASEPPSPGDENNLWLPAYRTGLDMGLPNGWKRHLIVARKNGEIDLMEDIDASDPVYCFGGFEELENKEPKDKAIKGLRQTREVLGALMKAFRFPGNLEEFATIDQTSALICLTHLVFDLTAPGDDNAFETLSSDRNKWPSKLKVTVPTSGDESLSGALQADGSAALRRFLQRPVKQQEIDLKVQQNAQGVWFELLNKDSWLIDLGLLDDFEEAEKNPALAASMCSLHLRRSEGAVPMENPPLVEQSEFGVKGLELHGLKGLNTQQWHIHDRLAPGVLEGWQLHYRLDVQDCFGQVVATASWSGVRERFDPPPQPSEAKARLIFPLAGSAERETSPTQLQVVARYPGLERQIREGPKDWQTASVEKVGEHFNKTFGVKVFIQRRPLDECGFFGDDDDFALLEGLKQADLNYDPEAAQGGVAPANALPPRTGDLTGSFDTEGLELVEIAEQSVGWAMIKPERDEDEKALKEPHLTVDLDLALIKDAHAREQGFQFHVALTRKSSDHRTTARAPTARLAPCTHEVVLRDDAENDKNAIQVFQIEYFEAPKLGDDDQRVLRFLKPEHWYLELQRMGDDADNGQAKPQDLIPEGRAEVAEQADYAVRAGIAFPVPGRVSGTLITAPAGNEAVSVGGLRVLVRDRVAEMEEASFHVAETIQPLPRLVSLLRPIQIENGMQLSKVGYDAAATIPFDSNALNPWDILGPGGVVEKLQEELAAASAELSKGGHFRVRSTSQNIWQTQGKQDEGLNATIRHSPEWVLYRDQQRYAELLGKPEPTRTSDEKIELTQLEARKSEFADPVMIRTNLEQVLKKNWNAWLERSRAFLNVSLNVPTSSASAAAKTPKVLAEEVFAASAWPGLGRLISVMRELGLTTDLVARNDMDVWGRLSEGNAFTTINTDAFKHLKVLAVETADHEVMATVRLVAMPWAVKDALAADPPGKDTSLAGSLFDPTQNQLHYWFYAACVTSPRLMHFRDQTREPLSLTLPPSRVMRWHWSGLNDKWHHNLEFAIQILDRYHRIRERIREARLEQETKLATDKARHAAKVDDTVLGKEAAKEIAEAARAANSLVEGRIRQRDLELAVPDALVPRVCHRITVPRTEPVPPHPGVFTVTDGDPRVIAFEMLECAERQQAAHNVLARTRYGHIQLIRELSGSFEWKEIFKKSLTTRQPLWGAASATAKWKEWLEASIPEFALPCASALAARGSLTPGTDLKWKGKESDLPDAAPASRRGGDVEVRHHLPFYFHYHLAAWFEADSAPAGSEPKEKRASATRIPSQLCLAAAPTWKIDETLDPKELIITIVPAPLGAHLNKFELAQAAGFDRWTLAMDVKPKIGPATLEGTDPAWDLPLLLLPDLWLEYQFSIDLAPPADPVTVLEPLITWAAPRQEGGELADLVDAPSMPLGFQVIREKQDAPVPSQKWSEDTRPLEVELHVPLSPQQHELLKSHASNGKARGLHLMLRRGPLFTDYLPLKCQL